MSMTLEQAIEHAEDTAKSAIGCECREEHRQLAEWLRELQERRKQPEIIRCGECKFSCECDDDMSSIIADYTDEIYCSEHDIYLYKDWYCADAERRTDEQPN